MAKEKLLLLLAVLLPSITCQLMKCSYGERGSLTSTCFNATPSFFRATTYRFDNLDETVRCVNCSLDTIAANSFDISGNQIINLDLTNSRIKTLRDSAFVGLIFLKNLFLQNNEISTLYNGTFRGIKKLEFLSFENNSLTALVEDAFKELINLTTLNIKNNTLTHVAKGAFNGLDQLKELNMEMNGLTMIDGIFSSLPTIKIISVQSNKLTEIKQDELLNLTTLIDLNLAKNSISRISDSAFLNLVNLEKLDLSYNNLAVLSPGSFRGLSQLEELLLGSNKIAHLAHMQFHGLNELRKIDFSYNQMTIIETRQYAGLPELRSLNVSHNNILGLFYSGLFALHSLHTLDVSYNKIDDIDYKSIEHKMPRLSYFDIEHNPVPCQLIIEIDHHFKHDNIRITGDKTIRNNTANCTITPKTPKEFAQEVYDEEPSSSNYANSYVVYVLFVAISLLLGVLFFLQYRTERYLNFNSRNQYRSQTHLITSSDLEARDDY